MVQNWGHVICDRVRDYTLQNGGGTFNTRGQIIAPSYGFAVSLDDERGVTVPVEDFTSTTVQVFALNNQPYINECNDFSNPTSIGVKCIGTWVDDGQVYLDVSTVVLTRDVEMMLNIARLNNQKSIYDFATKKVIWT